MLLNITEKLKPWMSYQQESVVGLLFRRPLYITAVLAVNFLVLLPTGQTRFV